MATPNRRRRGSFTGSEVSQLVTPHRIAQKYEIRGSDLERKAENLKKDGEAFLNQFNNYMGQDNGKVSKTLDESDVYNNMMGQAF